LKQTVKTKGLRIIPDSNVSVIASMLLKSNSIQHRLLQQHCNIYTV